MAFLDVKNLEAFYGRAKVLHGVNLEVNKGEIIAILGPNGAGKSSLLRAICGMIQAKGDIYFDGTPIHDKKTADIARMGIAHVAEGHPAFMALTVEENLRVGAISRKDKAQIARDIDRIYDYFPILKKRCKQLALCLSGGEQQMLAISRGLMLSPVLMLLDEPSFALAPLIIQQIFEIIGVINRDHQITIVLVEQNANLALKFAQHLYFIESGEISIRENSSDLMNNDAIRKNYLGY